MATSLTVGSAFNAITGVVSVPSSFSGSATTSGSLNEALQAYLSSLSTSIHGGTYDFQNNNIIDGSSFSTVQAGAVGSFEELSNRDSTGAVSTGSVSGAYTVAAGVTDFVVQAPGQETVQGQSSTKFALLGSQSNVFYSVANGAGSVYAAGGQDTLNMTDFSGSIWASGTDTVVVNNSGNGLSSGNYASSVRPVVTSDGTDNIRLYDFNGTVNANGTDNVYLNNQNTTVTAVVNATGSENISVMGAATTSAIINESGTGTTDNFQVGESMNATVSASGGANSYVFFEPDSGSSLFFINNSSVAGSVLYSSFIIGGTLHNSHNSVTVYGGAAGGQYVAGAGGNSLLVGGIYDSTAASVAGVPTDTSSVAGGAVTLYAGGSNDTLYATGGTGTNQLWGGPGTGEKLLASSTTGANDFNIGTYNGQTLAWNEAAGGMASTDGSGSQIFFIGNAQAETLTGSTVTGATNTYRFETASQTAGSTFTITDFGANSSFLVTNSTGTAGSTTVSISAVSAYGSNSSQLWLSDGTVVTLKGVSTSHITLQYNGTMATYV
ncbi:hypothetical protein [Acidocella sp.]|uniref:beta strand repeat-containing protein n=1 Tax=Acidocella sp. TaxID=50710 RepID=UPI002603E6EA|nr:hypothetical protein [Acidocella sp.]